MLEHVHAGHAAVRLQVGDVDTFQHPRRAPYQQPHLASGGVAGERAFQAFRALARGILAHQLGDRHADQPLGRDPEPALEGGVPEPEAPVAVDVGDQHGQVVGNQAQTLLAGRAQAFGVLALGHQLVEGIAQFPDLIAPGVVQHRDVGAVVADRADAVAQPLQRRQQPEHQRPGHYARYERQHAGDDDGVTPHLRQWRKGLCGRVTSSKNPACRAQALVCVDIGSAIPVPALEPPFEAIECRISFYVDIGSLRGLLQQPAAIGMVDHRAIAGHEEQIARATWPQRRDLAQETRSLQVHAGGKYAAWLAGLVAYRCAHDDDLAL